MSCHLGPLHAIAPEYDPATDRLFRKYSGRFVSDCLAKIQNPRPATITPADINGALRFSRSCIAERPQRARTRINNVNFAHITNAHDNTRSPTEKYQARRRRVLRCVETMNRSIGATAAGAANKSTAPIQTRRALRTGILAIATKPTRDAN